jgi:hypothetical protein
VEPRNALANQLIERSYAVLPDYWDPAKLARVRRSLTELYERLDQPPLWSRKPRWLGDNVEISNTGLVIHKLLSFVPQLHADLLDAELIALIRATLGADMHLEFAGAVISDHTRPFFQWHNHVGGIEDEKYRRLGLRPAIEKPERLAMIVYLDAMGPETGQLLIHPHRVSGAADPPGPIEQPDWPGRVAVTGGPGTVVLIDQTTWHAAQTRVQTGELRMFFGLWFAAACVAETERVDESLAAVATLATEDPLLRSLLPRGRDGQCDRVP